MRTLDDLMFDMFGDVGTVECVSGCLIQIPEVKMIFACI